MGLLPRTFGGRLAAVAVVGIALRAAYLYGPARHVAGIGDWYFYHWQAQLIAQGHGFVDPWVLLGTHQYRASAIHPPLYPLLLSGVYLLGGHSAIDQRSLGLVLGTVTLVLVALIGRRVGGDRVGLVAGLLYAIYPVMIAVDGDLMSEVLYSPLIAGMLLTGLAMLDRPSLRRAALLGALIALAALTRTEALLFVPFLVVPVAWRARPSWRGRVSLIAVAVLAGAVVLAPWEIRNESVFGRFVPISTNNATVLAGANCPQTYSGVDMGSWSESCDAPRTRTNEAAQAAIWQREGISYAEHHASRLPAVVLVRLLRVWDLWQPRRQARVFSEGQQIGTAEAGVAVFYVFMVIAVLGVADLWRRRVGGDRVLLVLLAPAVVVSVSAAVGYGVPRLRDSFDVALVVLAAGGLVTVRERIVARRRTARSLDPVSSRPAA
ncbi:MAG TPA: glycosyltransferase family 39 protein [Trebonia sp.]